MVNELPLRNTPLSEQVTEIISKRIKDGTYSPGSQLPPENHIAEQLKVSRSTIRKAMSVLSAKGLIIQKHGVGTFVSNVSKITNPLNEAVEFNDLITRFGHKSAVQFPQVRLLKADDLMAELLQIQPGDEIIESHKIFTADGVPVIFVVNSIPVYLIPEKKIKEIQNNPEITEPLYDFFEEYCGQRIEYHISSLKAIAREKLDLPYIPFDSSDPLLLIEEVAYNKNELPLWHSREYFPQNDQISFNVIRFR